MPVGLLISEGGKVTLQSFLQTPAFTLLSGGNFLIHGLFDKSIQHIRKSEWPGTILRVPEIWNTTKSLISLSHVTKLPAQKALSLSKLKTLYLCHGTGSINLRTPASTLRRSGSLWMGYWCGRNVSLYACQYLQSNIRLLSRINQ